MFQLLSVFGHQLGEACGGECHLSWNSPRVLGPVYSRLALAVAPILATRFAIRTIESVPPRALGRPPAQFRGRPPVSHQTFPDTIGRSRAGENTKIPLIPRDTKLRDRRSPDHRLALESALPNVNSSSASETKRGLPRSTTIKVPVNAAVDATSISGRPELLISES